MPCPNDLTRDLWLVGALPPEDTTRLADHVAGCPTCEADALAARHLDRALSAALALDSAELAYLDSLDLARRWRTAAQPALWWSWLALLTTLATLMVWSLAGPVARPVLDLLIRTGLGVVLGRALVVALWRLDQALLTLAASPLLAYSLPLLALLGLALLAWPRRPETSPIAVR